MESSANRKYLIRQQCRLTLLESGLVNRVFDRLSFLGNIALPGARLSWNRVKLVSVVLDKKGRLDNF